MEESTGAKPDYSGDSAGQLPAFSRTGRFRSGGIASTVSVSYRCPRGWDRASRDFNSGQHRTLRLRKERDPRFVERSTFWSKGYRIYVGSEFREHCFQFTRRTFRQLSSEVEARGITCVGQLGRERLWWTGREDLFWADDELTAEDVELLVWDRRRRQEGRLERLRKIRARELRADEARRERIPEEVRNFVWLRDEGRCVNCGSEEELQFDHVIPFARGGGTSTENVQILCGDCNRAKGDAIG